MAVRYIIGIDEAGRGPLAGPVTVGLLAVPASFLPELERTFFPGGIKDSKKLSPRRREDLYRQALALVRCGDIFVAHAHVPATFIDRQGITAAVACGIERVLSKLAVDPAVCDLRLDGLLQAPSSYHCQQTIIKGDEQESVIALASIIAKVRRDRLMERLGRKFPDHGFDRHKGYGTTFHYANIRKYGLTTAHRRTYLTRLTF